MTLEKESKELFNELLFSLSVTPPKEKKKVIIHLLQLINDKSLNEETIELLCTELSSVLKYHAHRNIRVLFNIVVECLLKNYPSLALHHLVACINDYSTYQNNCVTTYKTSKSILTCLEWIRLIIKYSLNSLKEKESLLKTLVMSQTLILSSISEVCSLDVGKKVRKIIQQPWTENEELVEIYEDILLGSDASIGVLLLGSIFISHVSSQSRLSKYKGPLLDSFLKVIISSRTKPNLFVVSGCQSLIALASESDFEKLILPAISKSMLRNPETILECVADVLCYLPFKISNKHVMEIGKLFATQLYSKTDSMRDEAAVGILKLARKCRSVGGAESLLKHLFNIYNGSEGKLSLATQKISILQGVGNLSEIPVASESLNSISDLVISNFTKILDMEVHDKTLLLAVEMLSLWCSKFAWQTVPVSLISCFKKKISSKNSFPLVNAAMIDCLAICFKGGLLCQGLDVAELLLKSFEKAVAAQLQINVVIEGLAASCLLFKLSSLGELESRIKLESFWNTVFDCSKSFLVSEKLLDQSSISTLKNALFYSEFLIGHKHNQLSQNKSALYKTFIHCLMSKSMVIRKEARDVILRCGCGDVVLELINEFYLYIQRIDLQKLDFEVDYAEAHYNADMTRKLLTENFFFICTEIKLAENEKLKIAMECLIPSHHPNLDFKLLWQNILIRLSLEPAEFILKNEKKQIKSFIEKYNGSIASENAISTLMKIQSDSVLPHINKKITAFLGSQDLVSITQEDFEIFLTPEGELYNKEVLEELKKNEIDPAKNMKRESKAYSYKEQQEDIQLRKELLEKKKQKTGGQTKVSEISEKQRELVTHVLEKESNIRKKLKVVEEKLLLVISLIRGAAVGNPTQVSLRFRYLLPLILKNTKSPLSAKPLCEVFIQLRKCVFSSNDEQLAIFIAHLTLRHENPCCELDKQWSEEEIGKASRRALEMLIFIEEFSAPTFAYFFWFLRNLMISPDADATIVLDVLKIISHHVEIPPKIENVSTTFSPKLLPRTQIFESLITIIGKVGGFLQQTAINTLVQVAACCSVEDGCDVANTDELNTLLCGLQSLYPVVRDASMKALLAMITAFPLLIKDTNLALNLTKRVWVAKFDISTDNRILAEEVWNKGGLDFRIKQLPESLLDDVISPNADIQKAVSEALSNLLKNLEGAMVAKMSQKLKNIYNDKSQPPKQKKDNLGRVIYEIDETWQCRNGIALALEQLASLVDKELITTLINFYIQSGLKDSNDTVRKSMLAAGVSLISQKGKESIPKLLPILETHLKKTPPSAENDNVRSGIIVLMGTLGRHMDNDDGKLKPIINRLIESLSTPSQQVQESVAESLHPLISKIKDDAQSTLKKLMNRLLNGNTFAERKGAAYGIAAVVRGVGILSIKQYEIVSSLTDAIQDKKNYRHREGALFALEQLCSSVGRLFEPYIIHILPHLLLCFGDTSEYVRTAADDCSKVVMSKLSGHGVKLVLPALLNALEEDSWRTKTGSVELLGAMAYCAPKQLSSCLPSIVPKLIEVLSDSHVKVQEAGAQALRVIGSVIRNPEIQAIVNALLDALQDPSNKIAACLSTLLTTKFIHFIDAPSLALIMPVVQRAFMDRSTETRKMAAQIIGNMYSLTDEKDLTPYLPTIMPGLKNSLLDPVPEVRSVSARALGAMVRGMGESSFEDLLPWLMKTLTSEASSVDRSGAAQGLSEVVGGLGLDKLHKLMPEIITTADRTDIAPHVKDGYLMMFIYMPAVFGNQFTPYIGLIIVPILKALADENEFVRETALKAGQRIVNMYAESAIHFLLPELERGLFDDNWRIRYSSVQLLGDLLYRISGVTGKMTTETANEDDNFGTEHSHKIIITALGEERRNRVLAGLYMGRSDVSLLVRQAALHVWKVVVTNTPRTLREILTTLFGLLLGCLASPNFDKRQVGARTLGDLVRKLGERVLPEIIPLLERGLESENEEVRQGVCIGLSEIMKSTSRDMILAFNDNLVPTVRKTLCDPLPEVRRAAAKTFESLHSAVGMRALDDILPYMLQQLKSDDPEVAERALDGLRQVMTIKSRVVLPYLIPQLTAPPINPKVLAILASVAGDALTRYLHKILPALLKVVASEEGECEMEYCQAVVLSVVDEIGIRVIMDQLQEATRSDNSNTRKAAINLLSSFCMNSKGDYSQYVPQLLRIFIHLMTDEDGEVLQLSWEALNAVTKSLNSEQQISVISDVRQTMKNAANEIDGDEKILPGFCLKKGISPLIPIFREAMLNGATEVKEQGALGLGEAIKLSSKESLQGNVVAITGPLIRAVGERFVGNVKAAVIETLAILLDKVGLSLKQFLPQLLTTFLKSLTDPHRQVRLKAAFALSRLVLIHGKADPLFLELLSTVKTTEDVLIKETALHTLRVVIIPAGDRMSDQVRRSLFMMLRDMLGHNEDSVRITAAAALACLMRWLSSEQLNVVLAEHILIDDATLDPTLVHGRSTALFVALKENAPFVYVGNYIDKINKILISYMQSSKLSIVSNGIKGCGYLFSYLIESEENLPVSLLVPYARSINHANNDIKQLLAKVCSYVAKSATKISSEYLKSVIPMLVNGTKEKNSYVKAHCEFALIAVLRLRDENNILQNCLQVLEGGAKESLNDVVTKALRRIVNSQQYDGKIEELDDTLLG